MKSFEDIIDEIIANMDKQRESAKIKAFVTDISMMLRANGVIPYMSEVTAEIDDNDALKTVFCCRLEKLDFSEHDKVFEDKIAKLEKENKALNSYLVQREQDSTDMIAEQGDEISMLKSLIDNYRDAESKLFDENKELKQRIVELESKEIVELPFNPLECANYLINATYERETSSLERGFKGLPDKVNSDRYTVDDLEQIAEHLLVYCKHNKELE